MGASEAASAAFFVAATFMVDAMEGAAGAAW